MAKVKFFLDNGANIHSKRESKVLDTVKDLRLDEGEWESMKEDEKYNIVEEWAQQYIEYGWKEI